jgi:SAM-dependent methyltransferase
MTCGTEFFHRDIRREYLRCSECGLVFVPSQFFLSADAEKACYDQHENRPDDPEYRRFLGRLFQPLIEKLTPGARGLDFGSGPGPTLSRMLDEAGFPTAIFDPFYAPDEIVWQDHYDFVTASEVVEHLHRPMKELQRIWTVLRPSGWLGIMTKRVLNQTTFAKWHYKNDPTHVVFFGEETFAWLARRWSAELQIVGPDVVLLWKPKANARQSARFTSRSSCGS